MFVFQVMYKEFKTKLKILFKSLSSGTVEENV